MNKLVKNSLPAQPRLTAKFFAERRKELFSRLPDKSVCIVVASPERTRNNDTEHPFRQSSDVLYLSGFPEPESALVLTKFGKRQRVIMFVRPRERKAETWTGKRFGVEGALAKFGAHEAHLTDEFATVIEDLLDRAEHVYYRLGLNEEFDSQFISLLKKNQKTLLNPCRLIHDMRRIKSQPELDVMGYAASVSARAHAEAMRKVRPGMYEYQLQTVVESVFGYAGAVEVAYPSIVAGGNNANILHYTTNREVLKDGDLVLLDAGCEFSGYASDITRTFPVNGKFTAEQRAIYELVLKAQLAAIKACKPGRTANQVHQICSDVLRRGLVELGILPEEMANKRVAERLVNEAEKEKRDDKIAHLERFFMHRTGHWLGLDVHDPAGCDDSRDQPLVPGMVLTVEPGLYLPKYDRLVPPQYRGIGVRIEDDVLITEGGCLVLSAGVPKTVDEIEVLMAEGRSSGKDPAAVL